MAVYKVKQGDTLSGIAQQNQTNVSNLQKLNPSITDPNVIYAGSDLNIPEPPKIVSTSEDARKITSENIGTINSSTNLPPPQGALQVSDTNKAVQNIIDQTNQILKNVPLDEANKATLNAINGISAEENILKSQAKEAEINKDYSGLNDIMTQLKEVQKQRNDALAQFSKDIQPLREKYLSTFTPSVEEQDLQTKIANIRQSTELGAQEQFGRGTPLALSTGRAQAIEQRGAILEKNLLTRLGLVQEARKAQREGLATGISMLQTDFDLQNKVRDSISNEETQILNRANVLSDNARQTLGTILDKFKGLDFDELTAEAQSQLLQIAAPLGIDAGLLRAGMKVAKDQQDFENLTKTKTRGTGGLTDYQLANTFNAIVGKYNASPLIQAADRTPVLKSSIEEIRKNPNNAPAQLSLAYAYIQALDTYQSAVREGELSLVNSIDSKIGKLGNYVQQITNGQIVRGDVALDIANNAEKIIDTINTAAKQKAQSFQSQADVVGVGNQFRQFTSGFTPQYSQQITPEQATSQLDAIIQGQQPQSSGGFWNDLLGVFGLKTK